MKTLEEFKADLQALFDQLRERLDAIHRESGTDLNEPIAVVDELHATVKAFRPDDGEAGGEPAEAADELDPVSP
jgi:hypothetical protein